MTDQQQVTLWLGATRYYMGRMTYAVSDFTELLAQEWPNLGWTVRALIERDVEAEFKRDDEARADGRQHLPLGMEIGRAHV